MSGVELVVDPSPATADLSLSGCASLEDFEDELREMLGSTPPGGAVVVALHGGRSAPATVVEAMRALLDVCPARADVVVRCLFASERARRSAERLVPSLARPPRWARFGALDVGVLQGDIVSADAEAIVNASNVRLELGAGVSGAIKKAVAHPDALQAEMHARAPIAPGEVVATSAHGLGRVRLILHAATASGGEPAVSRAYRDVLELAARMNLTTVAVPALGSGTGGVAPARSAALLRAALESRPSFGSLTRLACVLYDGETADAFALALGAT